MYRYVFVALWAAILVLALVATNSLAQTPVESQQYSFTQPAQPMTKALLAWSRLTGIHYVAAIELIQNLQAPALKGKMPAEQALAVLLANTDLRYLKQGEVYLIIAQTKIAKATPAPEPVPEEVVVVIASRAANRTAVFEKRHSEQIMDVLASDDVGDLPDLNVADAFRRIAGVNTENESDEGRFVRIRGIDGGFNLVTIDGMTIATTDVLARIVHLESIPITGIHSLQVIKTQSADLDGNSLGGTLNIQTLSAYDRVVNQGEPFFLVDGIASKFSLKDVPDNDDSLGGKVSVSYADIFGSQDQLGVLVNATYDEKNRDEHRWTPGYRFLPEPVNGQEAFRQRFQTTGTSNIWVRKGLGVKFEYRPSDNISAFLNNYHYTRTERQENASWRINNRAREGINVNEQGGGAAQRGEGELTYSNTPTKRVTRGAHFHLEVDWGEQHRLDFDVATSQGLLNSQDRRFVWSTPNTEALGYRYEDARSFVPWQTNDPVFAANPENYAFNRFEDQVRRSDEKITELKLDHYYNTAYDTLGWGLKSGVKFRRLTRQLDASRELARWQGAEPLRLNTFASEASYIPPNFFMPMPVVDRSSFSAFFNDQSPMFSGNAMQTELDGRRQDFDYMERGNSAYVQTRYGFDNGLSLTAGIRYEHTAYDSQAFLHDINTNALTPNTLENEYDVFLPSFNADYWLNDRLRLQLAFSRSLGRQPISNVTAVASRRTQGGVTQISRSNADLAPLQINKSDVSLSYYPDQDSLVSLALFYNRAKNFASRAQQETLDNGVSTVVQQAENNGSGNIAGAELSVIKNHLDFLPAYFPQWVQDFGLSANATWLDGKLRAEGLGGQDIVYDPLPQQARLTANMVLFYSFPKGNGEAGIGYNYTGTYPASLEGANDVRLRDYWQTFKQLDVQFRYDLSDRLSLKAQIRNLGDEARSRNIGSNQQLVQSHITFGHSYWLGVSFAY